MVHEEFLKLKEDRQHGNFLLPYVWYYTKIPEFYINYPIHWHDEFEIIYVKKGKMNLSLDLKNCSVNAGDIVFIKPKVLHGFGQYKSDHAETVTLVFSLSMLNAQITDACSMKYFSPMLEGKIDFPAVIHPTDSGYEEIYRCIIHMHKIYHKASDFFELNIKSELFKMFFLLLSNFCSGYNASGQINTEANTIKVIIEYIQANYMHQIPISELADAAGLSEHYLMRYFKSNMGITCVEYMNEYRLNIATHLLKETDYPIGIIAEKCGIPNVSYFNRVFKKAFNLTPKEYRKRKQFGDEL